MIFFDLEPMETTSSDDPRQLRQQISDLQAAVDRLQETSNLYRMVADAAADAILAIDQDGEIIYANPSTQQLTGYTPASLMGVPLVELIPYAMRDLHSTAFERFKQTGEKTFDWHGMELEIQHAEGHHVSVEVSFGAVKTQEEGYQFIGFLRDIRPRKADEIQRREHLAALSHADRLKIAGELATGLAHELNQPLAAICLNADHAQFLVQQQGNEQENQQGNQQELTNTLEQLSQQAERAGEIVRYLRELTARQKPVPEPFRLNESVHSVVRLLRHELEGKNIQLQLLLESTLPNLYGDRIQIEQVILNLLQNAIQSFENLPITDRVIQLKTDIYKDKVWLDVVDNGCGLPENSLEMVFDNFFTTKSEGLGLGLAICRSIAELHNGKISAMTRSNTRGSIFRLELPGLREESR